jgi:malonyl-CoA decarboxylase
MDDEPSGWLSKFRSLRGLWRDVAQTIGSSLGVSPRLDGDLPPNDAELLREQMRQCLQTRGGEMSARGRAAQLGRSYLDLTATGRLNFLRLLAEDFDSDPLDVDQAMQQVAAAPDRSARRRAERRLKQCLEPSRVRLLTQFTTLPDGVKFLVDMRAELIALARTEPGLEGLADDLRSLLAGWFDVGFLELRRMTWRSPALLLEKIIAYEAVHAIQGWPDLKNRLDSDRRLYAFFHPRMPDEPLIFIEVALTRGLADNIQNLLDEQAPLEDAGRADSAIFYSINNAQRGLDGISFGNFLIKKVVDDLSHEFPNLKTFATLSPIPGLRGWAERNGLIGALDSADDSQLARLAARYLTEINPERGRVRDPVAHFHLANGARLERINLRADNSARGQLLSAGVMVNYLYKLSDIEANHEAYSGQGKVAMASNIKALLKG